MSNIATFDTGSAAVSVTATAPVGVYYTRVHARNACGISQPSNELVIVVPIIGGPGTPPTAAPPPVLPPPVEPTTSDLVEYVQPTYLTHPWVETDTAERRTALIR